MQYPNEKVLVIPEALAIAIAPELWNPAPPLVQHRILSDYSFRDRNEVEENPAYKQIIPYILVSHNDRGHKYFLLSLRTKKQSETRLHNKYSLGQGGHVNESDFMTAASGGAPKNAILEGLKRELREEFVLAPEYGCAAIGLINDNSTPVGRVHLGLAYELRVASKFLEVTKAEKDQREAWYLDAEQLAPYYPQMESWSQILMDHVIQPKRVVREA